MKSTQVTTIEPGNRIQIPEEWAKALGLEGQVALDRIPDGIVVRACRPTPWDAFFATKLRIGSAAPEERDDEPEVTGDDLLF
jgi:hypothetical protein